MESDTGQASVSTQMVASLLANTKKTNQADTVRTNGVTVSSTTENGRMVFSTEKE